MSLILDALRKLERDKQPRDASVVVVGHVPWGGRDPDRRLPRALLAAAVVLALAAVLLWILRPPSPSRESPGSAAGGVESATSLPRAPGPGAEALVPGPTGAAPRSAEPLPTPSGEPPAPRAIDLPGSGNAAGPSAASTGPEDGGGPGRPTVLPATTDPRPGDAREPDRAGASSAPSGGDRSLRLTAISERDGRPVALLNDRLVREGDSFDGVRVLRIGPTEVEVEVEGKKRVIRF